MLKIIDDVIHRAVTVQSDKIYYELMVKKEKKKGDNITAEWYTSRIGANALELAFLEQLAEKCGALNNYYAEMEKGKIRAYVFNFGLIDIDDKKTQKEWREKIDKYYAKGVA